MNYELWKNNRKITTGLIAIVVLLTSFSPILAIKANAQFVVALEPVVTTAIVDTAISTDITAGASVTDAAVNTAAGPVKEFGLDSIAWTMANLIIERMTASTVTWINKGFKGSPAFVTDPEAFFTKIGDQIAGQYIFSNPNLNLLCGPISAKIKLALTNSYIKDKNWQCTLTQVGKNMDNFMSGFENGGWDSFFQISQNTQMNPIGAFLQAQNEMNLQITTRQGTKKEDLLNGKGFLSYKKCTAWATSNTDIQRQTGGTPVTSNCTPDEQSAGTCTQSSETTPLPQVEVGDTGPAGQVCTQTETVTPGSVIADQLNTALNTGSNKLVTADEINELVSALLNQAITQVVGGIGNGLKGLSEHDTSNGGKVFTEQMAADSTRSSKTPTVDYFGNAQDTSGSNPDLYKSAVNSQGSTQTTQPGNNPVSNPTSPTGTNGPGPIRTP